MGNEKKEQWDRYCYHVSAICYLIILIRIVPYYSKMINFTTVHSATSFLISVVNVHNVFCLFCFLDVAILISFCHIKHRHY